MSVFVNRYMYRLDFRMCCKTRSSATAKKSSS